jgi:hypothetical protein
MRIAICFSGQIERIVQFPVSFANQLIKLGDFDQCDLFFSHWDIGIPESEFRFYVNKILYDRVGKNCTIATVNFTPENTWNSKYKQRDCWSDGNSPRSIYLMFGGVQNADLLRQSYEKRNNFIYDLVIRSRLDIELAGEFNMLKWKQLLDNRKISIFPKNFNWFEYWNSSGMLNDQFFVSNSNIMTKISGLVDHIDEYVDAGCRLHPESLLWWHIRNEVTPPESYFGTDPWDKFPWYSFQNFETLLRNSNGW